MEARAAEGDDAEKKTIAEPDVYLLAYVTNGPGAGDARLVSVAVDDEGRLRFQHVLATPAQCSETPGVAGRLPLPGVIVTDANASSDYVRFAAAPEGLEIVDKELTFAEYWIDVDLVAKWRKKSAKCAEVLVPDCVEPRFILGAYVSCEKSLEHFGSLNTKIPVTINGNIFFM